MNTDTVTISLGTYNDMKAEIERLKKENKQKQIIKEVSPEWFHVLIPICFALFGIGIFMAVLNVF